MSLGFFLFLLFLIFIAWPIIRAVITMNRLRRNARKAFEQAGRAYGNEFRNRQAENRKPGWSKAPRRKKVIDRNEGEYVEWEEVAVHQSSVSTSEHDTNANNATYAEQQVTDVEWEEIKP